MWSIIASSFLCDSVSACYFPFYINKLINNYPELLAWKDYSIWNGVRVEKSEVFLSAVHFWKQ